MMRLVDCLVYFRHHKYANCLPGVCGPNVRKVIHTTATCSEGQAKLFFANYPGQCTDECLLLRTSAP